jgi:hypothetical protein
VKLDGFISGSQADLEELGVRKIRDGLSQIGRQRRVRFERDDLLRQLRKRKRVKTEVRTDIKNDVSRFNYSLKQFDKRLLMWDSGQRI